MQGGIKSGLVKLILGFSFSFIIVDLKATDITVDFTPYNCATNAYDTVVQFVNNDRLIIINRSPGAFPVQYIRSRNGIYLDTISSVYGDTLWSTLIGAGDTVISIHVLSMPGMCYGQRFHMQLTTLIPQVEEPIIFHITDRKLVIENGLNKLNLSIYDFSGRPLWLTRLSCAEKTVIDLKQLRAGWCIIVLQSTKSAIRRKVLLN
jgi:hypothetical protein